ncbi:MAG: class II aldolase/adducin family protein [Candidatus Omnitrophica bacterium]|nr:class II aldolase/adducin family protein [Candidatus Omnitrophota bacterium]
MSYLKEKKELIYWAKLLNRKGFVTATSGNISYKAKEDKILITRHDCYLGELTLEDILLVNLEGKILEGEGEITSEKKLHLDIHNKFQHIKVVIHAHPLNTVAFFHLFKKLRFFSFEAKIYLKNLKVIPQKTINVVDTYPVLKALENSKIVVLGNHGVVSIGEDFKYSFGLIDLLEEQSKVNLIIKLRN